MLPVPQVRIFGCPPVQPTRFYVFGQNLDNQRPRPLLTRSWMQVSGPHDRIRFQLLHIIDPIAILPCYLSLGTDLSSVRVLSWPQAG